MYTYPTHGTFQRVSWDYNILSPVSAVFSRFIIIIYYNIQHTSYNDTRKSLISYRYRYTLHMGFLHMTYVNNGRFIITKIVHTLRKCAQNGV